MHRNLRQSPYREVGPGQYHRVIAEVELLVTVQPSYREVAQLPYREVVLEVLAIALGVVLVTYRVVELALHREAGQPPYREGVHWRL